MDAVEIGEAPRMGRVSSKRVLPVMAGDGRLMIMGTTVT